MNSFISYEELSKLEIKEDTVKGRRWVLNYQDALRLKDLRTIVDTIKIINNKFE